MFDRLRHVLGLASGTLELRGTSVHTATDYGRDILVNSPDGWEVDQQWLWWVDGPGGGGANAFGNPPPDARGLGGTDVAAVQRCTSIIADTIAGLPWRVYRGFDQQATPRWMTDPQLLRPDQRVFGDTLETGFSPSAALSGVEFWTDYVTKALWFGDAWAWSPAGRSDMGQLRLPLFVLCRNDAVQYDDETREFYAESADEFSNRIVLSSANSVHLRGEPPYTRGFGTGVLDRFGADINLARAMRDYAANVFKSGIPAGYLKVNAPQITEDQATKLKTRWMSQNGSARTIAVLNATTEFHPVAVSPIDAQLDDARTWSLRDIALAFGVPAYMLGVPGDSSTYANVESRMTELRTFTLLPWIRRLESALDAQFAAGTEVKIVTDGTLRADTSTRYAAYESALRAEWLTVDEVRALEDRPPLPTQVSTAPEDDMPPAPAPDDTPAPAAVEPVPEPEPVPTESATP